MTSDNTPTITFDESASIHIIGAFGWTTDNEGFIVDEDGNCVESVNDHYLTVEEFGGVVEDDGVPKPLSNKFTDVVTWVSDDE